MSELAATERALMTALNTIRTMWPVMHGGTQAGSIAAKPAPKVLFSHEETSERTDDLPHIDVVLDLRAETTIVLNSWSRVVIDEQHLTHGLPLGHDVPGMCDLLDRWARWFSGHEAADDMLDEIQTIARKLRAATFPTRPTTVTIGACPTCGTTVRSNPHADTIRCRECGCEGNVQEWIEALDDGLRPVTLPKLATILHKRVGMRVTERTLRNWVVDGIFTAVHAFGPQPQYPRYDPVVAMRQILRMHRPCVVCGQPWQGHDPACHACRPLLEVKPRRADPVLTSRPGKANPKPVTYWPRVDAERRLCNMSDLPEEWCAHCVALAARA